MHDLRRRNANKGHEEENVLGSGQPVREAARGARLERTLAVALPLPADAPLLGVADVAAYLRMTPAAVRKLLDGRADVSDGELGAKLRDLEVRISPHRRYIEREPFLAWLRTKATVRVRDAERTP